MSILDGFLDGIDVDQNMVGTGLQALGAGLLSGNRYQPIGPGFSQTLALAQKGSPKAALKQILMQAGYSPEDAEKLSANEAVAKLALEQKETEATNKAAANYFGTGGTASPGLPTNSPPAPAGPAKGVTLNGSSGEIQSRFISGLKEGGLTNPVGLAAMAAYGQHESGYSPSRIAGSWSDPSESGQAGTSGGLLSWRNERLDRMRAATANAEDPVKAQAMFALKENPQLTAALQNAKTPEEANSLMANAWRFAGFNRPGGENAARLATTRSYLNSFGSQSPVQVAAGPRDPAVMADDGGPLTPGLPQPQAPMPVAPQAPRGGLPSLASQPTQVAGASPADLPVAGGQEAAAGFVIPGPNPTVVSTGAGAPARPVTAPATDADREQVRRGLMFIATAKGDAGKRLAEAVKLDIQPALKNLELPEAVKIARSAGMSDAQMRDVLPGAIPGNAPTSLEREYRAYDRQERAAGRPPLSLMDYQVALANARRDQINVGGQEKAYDADQGKSYADLMKETQAAGRNAPTRLANLNEAKRLMSTPGFTSGIGTERFALPAKQLLARLGGDPNAPASMETFRALSNKAVTDSLGGSLGAGVSNADVAFLQRQNQSLDNSPEANRQMIDMAIRLTNRQREVAQFARQYAAKNGGRLDVNYDQALADWAEKNPVFPDATERQQAEPQGQPQRQGQAVEQPKMPTNNATERALFINQSKENARAAIARAPQARDAILKRLRDAGVSPDGL